MAVSEKVIADIENSITRVNGEFPFKDYVSAEHDRCFGIAKTALSFLEPRARILDFGSGPCDKTAVLQALGFQCSAYDDLMDDWHNIPGNRERILSFVKSCGIDFRIADGSKLPFEKDAFDMVMLHSVLEHLHGSPRDLLNDLLQFVKPEGLLFITVPSAVNIRKRINVMFGKTNLPRFEGFYWYPGPFRDHIREYVKDDLQKLSEYLSLDILELRGCDHMLEVLPKPVRPAYLFVTKIFPGWKDSWLLVARKRKGWQPRKILPQDEMLRILGQGTSYEYVNK